MFLNQYNYNNITDGWIKLNAMHESYPGHHVQYVRSAIDATPDTVKLGAKNVPILEGPSCAPSARSSSSSQKIPSSRCSSLSAVTIHRCVFWWICSYSTSVLR